MKYSDFRYIKICFLFDWSIFNTYLDFEIPSNKVYLEGYEDILMKVYHDAWDDTENLII